MGVARTIEIAANGDAKVWADARHTPEIAGSLAADRGRRRLYPRGAGRSGHRQEQCHNYEPDGSDKANTPHKAPPTDCYYPKSETLAVGTLVVMRNVSLCSVGDSTRAGHQFGGISVSRDLTRDAVLPAGTLAPPPGSERDHDLPHPTHETSRPHGNSKLVGRLAIRDPPARGRLGHGLGSGKRVAKVA
jgi:hypothetical protein